MFDLPIDSTEDYAEMAAAQSRRSHIHVGPLDSIDQLIEQSGARYLVSVINEHMIPATPTSVQPEKHLRLSFNDIVAPAAGMTPPNASHVGALIEFAKFWNHDGPLVIHCLAGVSRSTASAFIVLCTLNPECPEVLIADCLRMASETADPNIRLVRIGDRLLERDGRMTRAIEAIAETASVYEAAQPFCLPSIVEDDKIT